MLFACLQRRALQQRLQVTVNSTYAHPYVHRWRLHFQLPSMQVQPLSSLAAAADTMPPSQQVPPEDAHEALPILYRRSMESATSRHSSTVSGVTFDDRQELLTTLKQRQPVMLVREPWNEFDALAVSVRTLRGKLLGYIPRSVNHVHVHEVTFGQVASAGPVQDKGIWGLKVLARPTLAAPTIDVLPTAHAKVFDDPEAALGPDRCQSLVRAALARANGGCEVSGLPVSKCGKLRLLIVPVWRYDEKAKLIRLVRASAVCEQVAQAKHMLEHVPGTAAYQCAGNLLRDMLHWSYKDLAQYQAYAHERKAQLDAEGWGLDLTLCD